MELWVTRLVEQQVEKTGFYLKALRVCEFKYELKLGGLGVAGRQTERKKKMEGGKGEGRDQRKTIERSSQNRPSCSVLGTFNNILRMKEKVKK